MDFRFEKNDQRLVATDTGWSDNGHSVYEVHTADGKFVDTVVVHPMDDIESAIDEWQKS